MAIEKKTIIDQIEIARDGSIQVRFALLMVEDGVEISSRWHRSMIPPGGDVDAMIAAVNADISNRPELRAPAVETEKVDLLKAICKLAHTKKVVTAYRERAAAEEQAVSKLAGEDA